MIKARTISEIQKILHPFYQKGGQVGFVPTMGALHQGHISLIKKAKAENDLVICSIFVNPTQFNDPKDLDRYPRSPEKDAEMLAAAGCDVLFAPDVQEIYPGGTLQRPSVQLGSLDKVMEGAQRPGHFAGVVQVVSRLFDVVKPQKAYFGQKDFQQVAVIREMVRQLHYPIQIIACPIVREPDGLAMSSRNMLLDPEDRRIAPEISRILFKVKEMSSAAEIADLQAFVHKELKSIPRMALEYFEIADSNTLQPLTSLKKSQNAVACIAVRLGKIRLIDNIILKY